MTCMDRRRPFHLFSCVLPETPPDGGGASFGPCGGAFEADLPAGASDAWWEGAC